MLTPLKGPEANFFKDFFFYVVHLKSIESVTILLPFCFGLSGHQACEILAAWPGIELVPPALEGEVLTTGP